MKLRMLFRLQYTLYDYAFSNKGSKQKNGRK